VKNESLCSCGMLVVYTLCMATQGGWLVVGLGNPDSEYVNTRHNIGKDILEAIRDDLPKKAKVAELNVYMNSSGGPIKKLVTSKKAAERLVVLHDELDLPLGRVKVSFGSSAGGHNGVRSIEKALKTKDYVRIRIGISGQTPSGKLKRPALEKITDFVLGKFKPAEADKLKKIKKVVQEALELLCTGGVAQAMTRINAR
jgi:peptidyl-tRNA hydrolase, PTH1 family